MKKILAITDMDSNGSGYRNICVPLFTELVKLGHEMKVAGLMYDGREQNFPFHLIPAGNFQDAQAICQNLIFLWKPDVILVALDLPLQAQYHAIFSQLLKRFPEEVEQGITELRKYVAITPLENGPLTLTWAMPLFNMDVVFFISELGKQEAIKAGVVKADHLLIGIDTESMRPPLPEEKIRLRDGLGIPQDAFVVLTVAANQERKNLWAGMKAISLLKQKDINRPIRYILVTDEKSNFGWKLRDLALSLGINQEYICFEKGVPQEDLWGLYAVADAYLQPSKAEGLGLPVMDAMASGVPVVATDTGALHELLENARGFLIPPEYTFIDVWGNSQRDMINTTMTANVLKQLAESDTDRHQNALRYIRTRTWDIPAKQIHEKIEA